MYCLYTRVAVSAALSCSSSEQKPSLRQRHRLNVSKAESRISLIVLLTAPKTLLSVQSRTKKQTAISQDCRLGIFIGRDTHTRLNKSVKFKIYHVILSVVEESSVAKKVLRLTARCFDKLNMTIGWDTHT